MLYTHWGHRSPSVFFSLQPGMVTFEEVCVFPSDVLELRHAFFHSCDVLLPLNCPGFIIHKAVHIRRFLMPCPKYIRAACRFASVPMVFQPNERVRVVQTASPTRVHKPVSCDLHARLPVRAGNAHS